MNNIKYLLDAQVTMSENVGTGKPFKRYLLDEETTSWVERETA